MSHSLHIDRVSHSFGRRKQALEDCTVIVPHGSTVALVGSNGAGKSTLMSIIAGILSPTSGRVLINNSPVSAGHVPKGLAFLTQHRPLYRNLTVAEMIRATRALNTEWDEPYARKLIADAEIELSARIKTLSGGQHSRVALALALARHPSVLLLDEPMADLDPVARRQVRDLLTTETRANGSTTIISSHIVTELANHCDHLLLLHKGCVVAFGLIDELLPEGVTEGDRPGALETYVLNQLTEGVMV